MGNGECGWVLCKLHTVLRTSWSRQGENWYSRLCRYLISHSYHRRSWASRKTSKLHISPKWEMQPYRRLNQTQVVQKLHTTYQEWTWACSSPYRSSQTPDAGTRPQQQGSEWDQDVQLDIISILMISNPKLKDYFPWQLQKAWDFKIWYRRCKAISMYEEFLPLNATLTRAFLFPSLIQSH